jgi:hypothetical protein
LFLFVTINKDIISDFKKKVARERQRTFYSPWTLPSGYILSQLLPCLPPHPHAHMCEHTCIRIGTGGPSEVRGYSRLRLSFRPSQYCVWHLLAGQFQWVALVRPHDGVLGASKMLCSPSNNMCLPEAMYRSGVGDGEMNSA